MLHHSTQLCKFITRRFPSPSLRPLPTVSHRQREPRTFWSKPIIYKFTQLSRQFPWPVVIIGQTIFELELVRSGCGTTHALSSSCKKSRSTTSLFSKMFPGFGQRVTRATTSWRSSTSVCLASPEGSQSRRRFVIP